MRVGWGLGIAAVLIVAATGCSSSSSGTAATTPNSQQSSPVTSTVGPPSTSEPASVLPETSSSDSDPASVAVEPSAAAEGEGSTSAGFSGQAPASDGLALAGLGSFKTDQGYTYALEIDWKAPEVKTDVGSEPPGQTDVVLTDASFSGTFTNTTTGGRVLPDTTAAWIVGLYPATSIVCKDTDNSQALINAQLAGANGEWCAIRLFQFLDLPQPGGAFTPGGNLTGIANGVPIHFTTSDTVLANSTNPLGLNATQIDQTVAGRWVKDANRPAALGVDVVKDVPQTPLATCLYKIPYSSDPGHIGLFTNGPESAALGCK